MAHHWVASWAGQLIDVIHDEIHARKQIFQYQYRDFFNETKFFDTDTDTFKKNVMGHETETETFAFDWQGMSTDHFYLLLANFSV